MCTENRIQKIIPQNLLTCGDAIRLALDKIKQEQVDTCWMDAGPMIEPEWSHCGDAEWSGGTIMNCGYRVLLKATPKEIWRSIARIGGKNGWYFGNILWRLRGIIDRLVGGVGLRRGRRHPTEIGAGDVLDFWRVLEVKKNERLLLVAEMKTPGEALLEFKILSRQNKQTELKIHSRFLPKGLSGILYWYLLYPFHEWIFFGMVKAMAKSIDKPILYNPQRFTPRIQTSCALPTAGQDTNFYS